MNKRKKTLFNSKSKIYSQVTFLIILIIFFGVNGFKILKNSNTYNLVENRMSYKLEKPSFNKFVKQEYQNNLEKAIGDQIFKYDYLKKGYSRLAGFINLNIINLFNLNKSEKYINLDSNILFKNSLVYMYQDYGTFVDSAEDEIKEINNIINNVKAKVYLYFVKTDSNFNFETNELINPEDYLKKSIFLKSNNIETFNFNNYTEYSNYFYSIDHHWNHRGSYKGYLEIADMMKLQNKLEIKDEICFDNAKGFGSKINKIGNSKYFEEIFCKYEFDMPEYEIYVNNELNEYGASVDELKESSTISYGIIYGVDYAEIIFINKKIDSDKNLLIYSNSFSNAINKLLASHYKNTYVIDGRHYQNLDLVDYINKKEIDDVLIIGNSMLFWDDIDW